MSTTRTITVTITAADDTAAAVAAEDLIGHVYGDWTREHPNEGLALEVRYPDGAVYSDDGDVDPYDDPERDRAEEAHNEWLMHGGDQ